MNVRQGGAQTDENRHAYAHTDRQRKRERCLTSLIALKEGVEGEDQTVTKPLAYFC